MRSMLVLTCLLGISCASFAQTNHASWTNLNGLQADQKIQVVDMNSKKHSGVFLSVSDSAISFRDNNGEKAIQKQDVRSVKLMKNNHRLRNTLIGTGAGFVAGTGFAMVAFGSKAGTGNNAAASASLICIFGGPVFGALWPSHKTIYSVSTH